MHRDDLPIPQPCHASWDAMNGDDATRFCNTCTEHVHDLSEMTRADALRLLSTPQAPCVRYATDEAGQILFRPSRRHILRASLATAAVLATTPALAATAPSEPPKPIVERLANRLRTWLFGPEACEAPADPEADDSPLTDTAEPPKPRTPKLMGKPRMGKIAPPATDADGPATPTTR